MAGWLARFVYSSLKSERKKKKKKTETFRGSYWPEAQFDFFFSRFVALIYFVIGTKIVNIELNKNYVSSWVFHCLFAVWMVWIDFFFIFVGLKMLELVEWRERCFMVRMFFWHICFFFLLNQFFWYHEWMEEMLDKAKPTLAAHEIWNMSYHMYVYNM